jgi:hypothetical protein
MTKNYLFAPVLFAAPLLVALTSAAGATLPIPFEATYETSYGVMSARGERKLEVDSNGIWKMKNNAHVLMVDVVEHSTFKWENNRAVSQSYEFLNPFSKDRSMSLSFDWPQNTVSDSQSKKTLKLAPGVFDKLSYQAQMQIDVCANSDHYPGQDFTVVDFGRLKTYRVEFVGRDVQKTAAGLLNTIHLKQFRPNKRDGKDTQIWLAADWSCLLVRLDQYDGDKLISLRLVNAKVNGVEVKEKK